MNNNMKEKSYSQGLGRRTHEDRKWSKRLPMAVMMAAMLLSASLFAQSNASKQPLPAFKYRADNAADTARQYKAIPNRETKAVSVCAVWNLTDTAERNLWSMADSSGKVAAKAGGRVVRAGIPVVRTDIAGLPRRMRKTALTFTIGGDSVRRDALLEGLFYPYALTMSQRVAAETYLALKYGVTLREDYLSPEGDTLWNHSSDSLFSHTVAGIGCDTLHGLQKLEGSSAESNLLRMKLLPSANNNRVSLLPRQYLLWGESEGKLSFGAGSAFALLGDSIVLFDLMERAWLVRATNMTNCRTASICLWIAAGMAFSTAQSATVPHGLTATECSCSMSAGTVTTAARTYSPLPAQARRSG